VIEESILDRVKAIQVGRLIAPFGIRSEIVRTADPIIGNLLKIRRGHCMGSAGSVEHVPPRAPSIRSQIPAKVSEIQCTGKLGKSNFSLHARSNYAQWRLV
jgi:hypothetical protein